MRKQRKTKGMLIHGKRYEHVGRYYEEKLIEVCEAIECLGFLEVINYTSMPYFHKPHGHPADFLTHLELRNVDYKKRLIDPAGSHSMPDISSDLCYGLDEIKHFSWHGFTTDPNDNQIVWLHIQIK